MRLSKEKLKLRKMRLKKEENRENTIDKLQGNKVKDDEGGVGGSHFIYSWSIKQLIYVKMR